MSSLQLDRIEREVASASRQSWIERAAESLICLYAFLITHGWLGFNPQRTEVKHTEQPPLRWRLSITLPKHSQGRGLRRVRGGRIIGTSEGRTGLIQKTHLQEPRAAVHHSSTILTDMQWHAHIHNIFHIALPDTYMHASFILYMQSKVTSKILIFSFCGAVWLSHSVWISMESEIWWFDWLFAFWLTFHQCFILVMGWQTGSQCCWVMWGDRHSAQLYLLWLTDHTHSNQLWQDKGLCKG